MNWRNPIRFETMTYRTADGRRHRRRPPRGGGCLVGCLTGLSHNSVAEIEVPGLPWWRRSNGLLPGGTVPDGAGLVLRRVRHQDRQDKAVRADALERYV